MIDAALHEEAISLTRDLIRVDSSNPPGNETAAALVLKRYLEANGLECELVARDPDRANLVARIPGKGTGPSLALLGHTDVVPADAQDWQHGPFSGDVDDDGYLWGRGTVDMKNETATRAVAMAVLAREGFQPNGDLIYIAEADEEDGTHPVGMVWLVGERPDLATDFAINEGGGDRTVLSDGRVFVPICVGEKCCLATLVTALGEAGHASTPNAGANAVPRLATLINRLAAYRPERRLLPETRAMLEALIGPFHEDDLDAALERAAALHSSFPEVIPALFGITIAPTRLVGSSARNVMPGRASVECDCRILPGDTPETLERELRAALGDDLPYRDRVPGSARGRHRCLGRHAAVRDLPELLRSARPRRTAAADGVHRLHRLALRAAGLRHRRLWPLALPPHSQRGAVIGDPQPRRAPARGRPRLRAGFHPARLPRGGGADPLSGGRSRPLGHL